MDVGQNTKTLWDVMTSFCVVVSNISTCNVGELKPNLNMPTSVYQILFPSHISSNLFLASDCCFFESVMVAEFFTSLKVFKPKRLTRYPLIAWKAIAHLKIYFIFGRNMDGWIYYSHWHINIMKFVVYIGTIWI